MGIAISLIGFIGLFYVFGVAIKFTKSLRTSLLLVAFGIFSGYISILSTTLNVFGIISEIWNSIIVLTFLGISAVLVILGNNKILQSIENIEKR